MCTNTKVAIWYNLPTTFSSEIYPACTLYVPESCSDICKATDGWKNFYNITEEAPSVISNAMTDNALIVYAVGNAVTIKSAANVPFSIYNAGGSLEASGKTVAGETKVAVNAKGICLVKVGSEVLKITL